MSEIAAREKDIDAILFPGDFIRHRLSQKDIALPDNWDQQKDILKWIKQAVNKHFPKIPVHWAIGNNDLLYHNQVASPEQKERYYSDFWNILADGQPQFTEEVRGTFMKWGFYNVQEGDECMLSINSNYFKEENKFDVEGADAALDWTQHQLKTRDCRFTITMHVPFGLHFYNELEMQWLKKHQERFLNMVHKFQDKIEHIVTAHFHSFDVRPIDFAKPINLLHFNVPSMSLYNGNNPGYSVIEDGQYRMVSKQLQHKNETKQSWETYIIARNLETVKRHREEMFRNRQALLTYQINRRGVFGLNTYETEKIMGPIFSLEGFCCGVTIEAHKFDQCMEKLQENPNQQGSFWEILWRNTKDLFSGNQFLALQP